MDGGHWRMDGSRSMSRRLTHESESGVTHTSPHRLLSGCVKLRAAAVHSRSVHSTQCHTHTMHTHTQNTHSAIPTRVCVCVTAVDIHEQLLQAQPPSHLNVFVYFWFTTKTQISALSPRCLTHQMSHTHRKYSQQSEPISCSNDTHTL